MAILNILAKSSSPINWDNLLGQYTELDLKTIEVFPIPKELGFDEDCIGVNVQKGYESKDLVMSEIERAFRFFLSYNMKMVELYDGVELKPDNVLTVTGQLL